MFVEFLSGLEHPAEVAELFGEYTDMLVAGDPVFASYLALQSFEAKRGLRRDETARREPLRAQAHVRPPGFPPDGTGA